MSEFYTRKPVPTWRLLIYGIIATGGVAALGYYQNDKRLYIFSAFCGAFVLAFGFVLSCLRSNGNQVFDRAIDPARSKKRVWLLLAGALLVSSTIKIIFTLNTK